MPGRRCYEFSHTLQLFNDGHLVEASKPPCTDPGDLSGMATVHNDVMLTDAHNNTVSIYNQKGGVTFKKQFDYNVWDCAHLRKGSYALLSDSSIKLFTQEWAYYRKIPVSLREPRQLVVDSDDFFVVADAACEEVAVYHAKSGQLLSEFTTAHHSAPNSPRVSDKPVFSLDNVYTSMDSAGTGITVNSQDFIYIAGRSSGTVHVFSHYGAERIDLQPSPEVAAMLEKPVAICFDKDDNILLADAGRNQVVWFSADWSESEVVLSERDGLSTPISLAITENDCLIVADKQSQIFLMTSIVDK